MKSVLCVLCTALVLMLGAAIMASADDITSQKTAEQTIAKSTPAGAQSGQAVDSSEVLVAGNDTLVVYYFHSTKRCANCLKIEAYTKGALDSNFASPLKDGLIVWRMINTDEDANKHYRDDYQLYTKSVILSAVRGGKEVRWKNLDKVWDFLGDEAAFKKYISDEVIAFMKAR
jgi:hypothetical protein